MPPRRPFPVLPAVALLALAAVAGRAAESPSLREHARAASVVVLATPDDPVDPQTYRVDAVLAGTGVNPGERITPAADGVRAKSFDAPDPETNRPRPRRVERALLFLRTDSSGKRLVLPSTGFRFCTADGRTLVPSDRAAPVVDDSARWGDIVAGVRDDLAVVSAFRAAIRQGRPARRAEMLTEWVKARRADPRGWEDMRERAFDALFAGATPAQAWQHVRLYAEACHGDLPAPAVPLFATPAGRSFLFELAARESTLTGDRVRALSLLARRETLWPTAAEAARGAGRLSAEEQRETAGLLARLLAATREEDVQVACARAAEAYSLPPASAASAEKTTEALPELVKAYRDAQPGPVRDALASAVSKLAPPEQWKTLSGNAGGISAAMRDVEKAGNQLTFFLQYRSAGEAVYERPVVVAERLGTLGFISESTRHPVTVLNRDDFADGWKGDDLLACRFDLSQLKPGNAYKLRVAGVAGKGKDGVKWLSEPFKVTLPAANPNDGPYRRGMFR